MTQQISRGTAVQRILRAGLVTAMAGAVLGGCVAVAGGAMVGGAMVASDRRSMGAQVDDQTIEVRAADAISRITGSRAHATATSYNRIVLLSGEVPTEADRTAIEAAVRKIENVRSVVNDLVVGLNASASEVTSDSIVTGKVKAAFLDVPTVPAASVKVVTERGVVFLMGRVTEAEGAAAANAARTVAGVKKVVKVFEFMTPAEVAALGAPGAASAPASAPQK
jgi:osmotically-inducible protein OsmY